MLELVALRLLCAVAQPHIYSETVVIAACAGGEFTTKGKTVKHPGWKALEDAYRAKMKDAEPKKEGAEKALPELTEGQTLSVAAAIVKEGKSSPPQHFTEDTLLSAMETAGKEDMPEDAERKVWGHRPPVPVFWKSWYLPVFWNEKEQENGAASPFPRCSFPDYRSAGTAAIAAFDCRVGVPPGRDRARAACPGGVSGRDQHHAERSGGNLSGHQGNRVPVHSAP